MNVRRFKILGMDGHEEQIIINPEDNADSLLEYHMAKYFQNEDPVVFEEKTKTVTKEETYYEIYNLQKA